MSETNAKIDSREKAIVNDEIKSLTRKKNKRTSVTNSEINILEKQILEHKQLNSTTSILDSNEVNIETINKPKKRDEYPLMSLFVSTKKNQTKNYNLELPGLDLSV